MSCHQLNSWRVSEKPSQEMFESFGLIINVLIPRKEDVLSPLFWVMMRHCSWRNKIFGLGRAYRVLITFIHVSRDAILVVV